MSVSVEPSPGLDYYLFGGWTLLWPEGYASSVVGGYVDTYIASSPNNTYWNESMQSAIPGNKYCSRQYVGGGRRIMFCVHNKVVNAESNIYWDTGRQDIATRPYQ